MLQNILNTVTGTVTATAAVRARARGVDGIEGDMGGGELFGVRVSRQGPGLYALLALTLSTERNSKMKFDIERNLKNLVQ